MVDFWANWIEAVRFTCEAQGVISARLMLFASAAPNAAVEADRMISEKIVAFSAAHDAAKRALAEGLGIYAAAERAYQPLRRCVSANSSRLGLEQHDRPGYADPHARLMQKSHTHPESLWRCVSLLACPNFAFSNRS